MKMIKTLLAIFTGLAFANNALAANKTHITDMLGAGNSRMDIAYGSGSRSSPGTYVFAGGNSLAMDTESSGSAFAASYSRGITDHFDISITFPFLIKSEFTRSFSAGPFVVSDTYTEEGQGDWRFAADYLVLDKKQDRVSWKLYGSISPSTASSDESTPTSKENGVVVATGTTGKTGRGYMATTIGSTVSLPMEAGDVFIDAQLDSYGKKTDAAGITSQRGKEISFTAGTESMLDESIMISPYARINFIDDTTVSNGLIAVTDTYFDLGLSVTVDLSDSASIRAGVEYSPTIKQSVSYPNGDKFNLSGHEIFFGLQALLFF